MNSRHNPKWSIIIPTYNYGHFLPETLNSVFSQGRKDIQIVLIDDASDDNTYEVVEPFLSRIEYYRNEKNLGAAGAWKEGISKTRGEYLVKLDADDQLLPGALDAAQKVFEANRDVGIVISSSWLLDDASQRKRLSRITKTDLILSADVFRHKLLGGFFFKMPSCAFRADALRGKSPPDTELYQIHDWEFILRVTRGSKAVLLQNPAAIYRVHESSISSTARSRDRLVNDMKRWLALAEEPGERQLTNAEIKRLKGSFGELMLTGFLPAASLRSWRTYFTNYGKAIQIALDGGFGEFARMHVSLAVKALRLASARSDSAAVVRQA